MKSEPYPPLSWIARSGLIYADTGGHGRYVIRRHASGGWM